MYQSFFVPNEHVAEVKKLVRSYPSLRFKENPFTMLSETHFCLTGDVEEFNSFNQKIESILNPVLPEEHRLTFFDKLKKFFLIKP